MEVLPGRKYAIERGVDDEGVSRSASLVATEAWSAIRHYTLPSGMRGIVRAVRQGPDLWWESILLSIEWQGMGVVRMVDPRELEGCGGRRSREALCAWWLETVVCDVVIRVGRSGLAEGAERQRMGCAAENLEGCPTVRAGRGLP